MVGNLLYKPVQIPGASRFEVRVANRLRGLLEGHVDEIHSLLQGVALADNLERRR